MYSKRLAVFAAFLLIFSIGAAQAGIEVWAVVDNQTSSTVSLGGSSTFGTFTTGPRNSIAASTRTAAATTWNFGSYDDGYLIYGPCSFYWNVQFYFYPAYSSVEAYGTGCSATVLAQIPNGHNIIVVVEFTIA